MSEQLENFPAAIDAETMRKMEEGAQRAGVNRRLVLLALARDADALSRVSVEAPEAFGEMLEGVDSFLQHAKALHEAAEAAAFRLRVADCRGTA